MIEIDIVMEGATVLEPRDGFDQAVIGYIETENGNVAAYSVSKILDYLKKTMDPEEAEEWFEYNTVRAIPYMGDRRPVLVYDML